MRRAIWMAVAVAGCAPAEPVRYELPGWDPYCELGTSADEMCRAAPLDLAPLRDGKLAILLGDGQVEVVEPTDDGLQTVFEARGGGQGDRSDALVPCDLDGNGAEDIVVDSGASTPYTFYATEDPATPYAGRLWVGTISDLGCADFDADGYDDLGAVSVNIPHSGSPEEGPFIVIRGTNDGLADRGTSFGLPVYDYAVTAVRRVETCGATMVASSGVLASEVAVSEYFPDTGFSSLSTLPLGGTAKRMRLLELDDALVLLVLIRPAEDETSLEVFRRPACDGTAFMHVGEHALGRVIDWDVDHDAEQVLLVDGDSGSIRVFQWTDSEGLIALDELPALAISAAFYSEGTAHGILWASVTEPVLTFSPLD